MTMKYYIVDLYDGIVKGTNSEEVAASYAECDDFFVIRPEDNMWITDEGEEEVEEVK